MQLHCIGMERWRHAPWHFQRFRLTIRNYFVLRIEAATKDSLARARIHFCMRRDININLEMEFSSKKFNRTCSFGACRQFDLFWRQKVHPATSDNGEKTGLYLRWECHTFFGFCFEPNANGMTCNRNLHIDSEISSSPCNPAAVNKWSLQLTRNEWLSRVTEVCRLDREAFKLS